MDKNAEKIYSGVKSFDTILSGGVPAGSFVLLQSEVGAGAINFLYTSMLTLSRYKEDGIDTGMGAVLPERICYISFTKPKEHVLKEASRFKIASTEELEKYVDFVDLSYLYFLKSKVPRSWTRNEVDSEVISEGGNIYDAFIAVMDMYSRDGLIIIDNLNDLIRMSSTTQKGWQDLIMLLKGIERMSKKRNINVYAYMVSDIFDRNKQEEISDCVDSVLVFKWDHSRPNLPGRKMFIKKLMGYMPMVEEDQMVVFETKVSASAGFQISNIKEIIGR